MGPALSNVARITLPNVIETFRRWLYLPDAGALVVAMGAVAAHRAEGDPVWLLLVGPPGSGKTEILTSLSKLPMVHQAATLTEAALLSGSPSRERTVTSTGGLLRTIGQSGILACKDFGSVLSMHRDKRAELLAALREIYDGGWTRQLGSDGGRTLSWDGKLGFLGGVTSTIDMHHAVMSSLGERFLLYRFLDVDADTLANRALASIGRETEMRRQLMETITRFFDEAVTQPCGPSKDDVRWLVALSTLVSRCRSAVERDGKTREIELIPDAEMPGRLVRSLAQLLGGLVTIGVDPDERRRLIRKTALDCIPKTRRRTIEVLAGAGANMALSDVAAELGYPTATTRRALEDLAAHSVVTQEKTGKGQADLWSLSSWTAKRWREIS